MKIVTKVGNLITNVKDGHIVSGCNAQGVMGSGFALGIKQTYPHVFDAYRSEYENRGLKLGRVYPVEAIPGLTVWNAITQNLYGTGRRQTNYEAVARCFEQINFHLEEGGIDNVPFTQSAEIHIPFIGAGLGGGRWNIIKTIIEDTVQFPITVWSIDGKMADGSPIEDIENP